MKRLHTDPNPAAVDDWMLRMQYPLEEVRELPAYGEELVVSKLSALSREDFMEIQARDIRLVTADGLDTRRSTGTGDWQQGFVSEFTEALRAWGNTGGTAETADTQNVRERLQEAQRGLVDAQVAVSTANEKARQCEERELAAVQRVAELEAALEASRNQPGITAVTEAGPVPLTKELCAAGFDVCIAGEAVHLKTAGVATDAEEALKEEIQMNKNACLHKWLRPGDEMKGQPARRKPGPKPKSQMPTPP